MRRILPGEPRAYAMAMTRISPLGVQTNPPRLDDLRFPLKALTGGQGMVGVGTRASCLCPAEPQRALAGLGMGWRADPQRTLRRDRSSRRMSRGTGARFQVHVQ